VQICLNSYLLVTLFARLFIVVLVLSVFTCYCEKCLHPMGVLLLLFVYTCLSVCQNADGHSAVHGAFQRTSNGSILRVPGFLRWPVVSRRVLVLQHIHARHARGIRSYAGPAAAQKHGGNT